jgi:intracellular multiplication protein IcmO
MMGQTLGNTVEGGWETAVGSKQTRSSSSFMTVFDEVGYYTTAGMAVMAAQARSLGFSLVFAAQDLPAMEKRIKTAAKSIVGNCNLKILGRIEDPTETKDFVQKHGGMAYTMETKGFSANANGVGSMFTSMAFSDDRGAAIKVNQRVDYDHLRGQREGEAHLLFGDWACKAQMFYAVPEKAKALRVHRLLPVPGVTKSTEARDRVMLELTSRLKDKEWTALTAGGVAKEVPEIVAMGKAVIAAAKAGLSPIQMGVIAVTFMTKLPALPKSSESVAAKNGAAKAPYGISDDFGEGAATAPQTAAARAVSRQGMPPLSEGDEFAIEDLVQAPASAGAKEARTFVGADADLSRVIPPLEMEEVEDFSTVVLPENILSVLAQTAQQVNDGLRGKSAGL